MSQSVIATPAPKKSAGGLFFIVGLVLALLMVLAPGMKRSKSSYDMAGFGKLPVLLNGRIKPMDTVARTTLVMISGKQTVRLSAEQSPTGERERVDAVTWLMDTMARPQVADTYPVFRIDNANILVIFDKKLEDGRYYSFNDLRDGLTKLQDQAGAAAELERDDRTRDQRAMMDLYDHVRLYHQLKNSLQLEGSEEFATTVQAYEMHLERHRETMLTGDRAEIAKDPELQPLIAATLAWQRFAGMAHLRVIPPADSDADPNSVAWLNPGEALLFAWESAVVPPAVHPYAAMATSYGERDPEAFNAAVQAAHEIVDARVPKAQRKAGHEVTFNRFQPFITSLQVYVLVFLLACGSWLVWPQRLTAVANGMLWVAFTVHTVGLIARVYLQGYAPVTNLYSSAVFVGWAAALLGLILERLYRNGIGSASAGAVGFVTLIIAHMLSLSGDTMEMMRAVLDSNFWLGTHVVTVTIGYSGMFLAGLLAIFYIFRGLVDRNFDRDMAKNLARMIYGITCFSTLFSFVGTVLGGIWADQSWGRFWGWDPKENGALLIVLWCAMMLHARWGGYIKDRGLAVMAVFGNIITAFSWFGVNLLSVGLHSYGFMERGFVWLMVFYTTQLVVIGAGLLPFAVWRSAYGRAMSGRKTPPPAKPATSPTAEPSQA